MTRILMVRHGQTNYNVCNRYQGQLDTALNEVGIAQANALKERILKNKIHIDEVWSSDLQRTRATVAPIAEALSVPMHLHAGLREVNVGDFTDKTHETVNELYEKELNEFSVNPLSAAYPNGESNADARKRAYKTVCEIAEKNDGKTLLLASHGGTIYSLIVEIFLRLSLERPKFNIPNCSMITFEYENGNIALISLETAEGEEIKLNYNDKKDIAVL